MDSKCQVLFLMCHIMMFSRETNLWLSEEKCVLLGCPLLHWMIKPCPLLKWYTKQGAIWYMRVSPGLE